ncbi:MAG: type 2 isopentenyl-diphosphate Delta-isomerase [Anaerolineae bacterium]
MADADATARRKVDHVRINLSEDVESRLTTGLERYHLTHRALPELELDAVSTATTFLGKSCAAPLLISSMTGGANELADLNLRLAEAAQERRIAMGVGSQRAAFESSALAPTFDVRRVAPDIPLFANLGAVQLNYGYGVDECRRAVEEIEADALILHLNPLQEALQPEGDTRWSGVLGHIEEVARALDTPVIAKEVGWGICGPDARRLADAGVAAIDVAGAGGTSWSEVEKHRAPTAELREIAGVFVGWGVPTADSLLQVREAAPELELIASGGLRDGIDVAKCVALGAGLCGLAGPFLRAAAGSTEAVVERIDVLSQTLRIAMFASGAADLAALRGPGVLTETR